MREKKENAAEQVLAKACSEYDRRRNLLEDTKLRLETVSSPAGKDKLDVLEEMHLSFYRGYLGKKIDVQEREVEKAGLLVENSRYKAVQARQERQVIEKLKDKQLQNYMQEAAAREQKEVDELALYAYLRRMKQSEF